MKVIVTPEQYSLKHIRVNASSLFTSVPVVFSVFYILAGTLIKRLTVGITFRPDIPDITSNQQ